MRSSWVRRGIASLATLALAASFIALGAGRADALDVCNGVWTPALKDITINQGLGTYPTLVRGKTTIARLFLAEPTCAPQNAEQLVGATVTVADGAQTLVDRLPMTPANPGPNYPPIDYSLSAPTNNGTGNPIFKIPALGQNDSNTAQVTLTFSFHVDYRYQAVTGGAWTPASADFRFSPGTATTPITATMTPASNPLRILVVPMGDRSDATSGALNMCREFPEARFSCTATNNQYADTGVQNGMAALSRLMPVADGVGDLTATTGGLRYRLDDANMIDLGPNGLKVMTSAASGGKFCGTGLNFAQPAPGATLSISSQLTAYLNSWNSTKGNPPADRVVGVVWQGISSGQADGCSEGFAAVNGTVAWVRDFVDQIVTVKDSLGLPSTAPDPSMTGATLSMEVAHTLGSVPKPPTGTTDPRTTGDFHSTNTSADPTQTQRAYNTTLAQWMSSPMSSMHFSGDSSGYTNPTSGGVSQWNNNTALYEQQDYEFLHCGLTPGMTTLQCPSAPIGTVGTAGASAAYFVLSGTTDGAGPSTTHIHSYFSTTGRQTTQDLSSSYHLIQRSGSTIINSCAVPTPGCVNLGDQRVPVINVDSDHNGGSGGVIDTTLFGTIDATLPADPSATSFELWNGTPPAGSPPCVTTPQPGCLYARGVGDTPVITTTGGGAQLGADARDFSNAAGQETAPAISPDGRAVAWVTSNGIVVQQRDVTTNQSVGSASAPLAGADPSWLANGVLAFAVNGDVKTVTVDTSTATPTFGTPKTIYNHLLQTPPPIGSTDASDPAGSPDGSSLVLVVNGDLWKVDASGNPSNPVVCQLSSFQASPNCVPVTHDGSTVSLGNNAAPSWGSSGGTGLGLIAYNHGSDLWTLDPNASSSNFNRLLRLTNAAQPAWGASLVGYVQGGNLWVADSSSEAADHTWSTQTQLTTAGTDASPSLTSSGGTIAFDRNVGTASAPNHDIFVGSITSSSSTIQFTVATTGDPALLEADLFVECASTYEPIFVEVPPSATSGNTATFTVTYDDRLGCPGGTVDAQVTNGFQRTPLKPVHTIPPGTGPGAAPSPAIAAPTPGSLYYQYDPVILVGSAVEAANGTNNQNLQTAWYLTGPSGSGYSNTLVATTSSYELGAPVASGKTGWTPGSYTLTEKVTNPATGLTGVATTTYVVLADPNHLGTNVTVAFNPQTLYVPSNGNDVTVIVKPQTQKLSTIDPKTVHVVQVGNLATNIAIDGSNGWTANSDGSYTAKFSRLAVSCAVLKTGLVGFYVPIVIAGSSSNGATTIRGYDPKYPNTSPNSGSAC